MGCAGRRGIEREWANLRRVVFLNETGQRSRYMSLMIKQHFGIVCLSIAIVIAAAIFSIAFRYEPIAGSAFFSFDRWTGTFTQH
jgi:hypothetical protein